ncbi:hypothetical protein NQ317_012558 [Molorchus minor]|uniref:RING-type domain-containing protein n=1 Tax=Molorchus minor TaxID=1323400 RepID=A0ABQ9K409_9CUCU|nr:hypothetical protein NQ317_012558 [Molorchus minor]
MIQDKLLSKLEESEPELAACQEEECVICINAKATMQTSPCGHQVVCRKCFVKTIQIAVSQRLLPLRCGKKFYVLRQGLFFPLRPVAIQWPLDLLQYPNRTACTALAAEDLSISSTSCSSDGSKDSPPCCGGSCLGAYPRQPVTGAIRRSQQHAMKMRLQDYCRPSEKSHVNRLPPIRELPGQSPLHSAPPASTRIRCAQKIVTQLELPLLKPKGHKYEKLPQDEEDDTSIKDLTPEKETHWWSDKKRDRTKCEENIDNRKNEIAEKQMELKEKLIEKAEREKAKKLVDEKRL